MKKQMATFLSFVLLATPMTPCCQAFASQAPADTAATPAVTKTVATEQAIDITADLAKLDQAEAQLAQLQCLPDKGEFAKFIKQMMPIIQKLKADLKNAASMLDYRLLAVTKAKADLAVDIVNSVAVGSNDMVNKTLPARTKFATAIERAMATLKDPIVSVGEVNKARVKLQKATAAAVATRDINEHDVATVIFRHRLAKIIHEANVTELTYCKTNSPLPTKQIQMKFVRKQLAHAILHAERIKDDPFSKVADTNHEMRVLQKAIDTAKAQADAVKTMPIQ